MNLDFSSDFNDWSHLNYYGSCKFIDYLAKDILKKIIIFFMKVKRENMNLGKGM